MDEVSYETPVLRCHYFVEMFCIGQASHDFFFLRGFDANNSAGESGVAACSKTSLNSHWMHSYKLPDFPASICSKLERCQVYAALKEGERSAILQATSENTHSKFK